METASVCSRDSLRIFLSSRRIRRIPVPRWFSQLQATDVFLDWFVLQCSKHVRQKDLPSKWGLFILLNTAFHCLYLKCVFTLSIGYLNDIKVLALAAMTILMLSNALTLTNVNLWSQFGENKLNPSLSTSIPSFTLPPQSSSLFNFLALYQGASTSGFSSGVLEGGVCHKCNTAGASRAGNTVATGFAGVFESTRRIRNWQQRRRQQRRR